MKKIADFCWNLFVSVACVTLSMSFIAGAVELFKDETPSEN